LPKFSCEYQSQIELAENMGAIPAIALLRMAMLAYFLALEAMASLARIPVQETALQSEVLTTRLS